MLFTCIIASIVTENASKRVVREGHQDDQHMEHVEESEEQIMIPIANINNMEPILDFAALIKSKKSPYPMNIVSVVPNDVQAEKNLLEAKRNLENTAKYASGAETEVELLTTVDINIPAGIARMAKKVLADCVIMGWPSVTSFVEKIVGEKSESILNNTDTTLFMCRIEKPLITHRSITVFVPPLAESEVGFEYWLEKVLKLSQELTLPVNFVCDARTETNLKESIETQQSSVVTNFAIYDDWDNIHGLATFSNTDSLLIFVSSRYGEVSYRDSLDGLARRVGKYYKNQNVILIFPSRQENQHIDMYESVEASPIFRKISREIGNMFNKEKNN